jgi:hypothetical protein
MAPRRSRPASFRRHLLILNSYTGTKALNQHPLLTRVVAPHQQVAKTAGGRLFRHREKASREVSFGYLTTPELPMNAFYYHHKDNIRFGYRCLDRIERIDPALPAAGASDRLFQHAPSD